MQQTPVDETETGTELQRTEQHRPHQRAPAGHSGMHSERDQHEDHARDSEARRRTPERVELAGGARREPDRDGVATGDRHEPQEGHHRRRVGPGAHVHQSPRRKPSTSVTNSSGAVSIAACP
jgi:hypothetical protein